MSSNEKLEKAIIETLTYSSLFKYPLSFCQLGTYLGKKTSYKKLVNTLRLLEKKNTISQKTGKYFITNKATVNWKSRLKEAKKKRKELKQTINRLEKIPWIKLLAITGPIAASNPEKEGDIDVLIISEANRLWLTRAFVVLYLKALGKYRTDEDPTDKICPNLYISENNLVWEQSKQNLYIASEIVRMQPLINRGHTYTRFLEANTWIKDFFPNIRFEKIKEVKNFNPGVLDFLENLSYKIQKSYMQNKITTEKINEKIIHFNKNDKSEDILKTYNKELKKIFAQN